jgi:subtilisin family serine protease
LPDHSPEFKLVDDTSWTGLDIDTGRIDPGIRLVAALIDAGDAAQLFRRTGMRLGADGMIANPSLPLFLEIGPDRRTEVLEALGGARIESQGFSLSFARAYLKEVESNPRLRVIAARFGWSQRPIAMSSEGGRGLRHAIASLLRQGGVKRLTLPSALQPTLEASLYDMEMPPDRRPHGQKLTGKGVIVGVIDDGCAFAHPNFLQPGTLQSRILFLWDQAGPKPPQNSPYWSDPGNFPGRELTRAKIDAALAAFAANGRVDDERLYEALGDDIELSAHGTHVLDIAAGNGASLMGYEGVANEADIIFVQLPRDLVEQGGAVLEDSILDGVHYVFERAAGKQAVVNISFGGYCGPHDGSSGLASGIDAELQGKPGRAVVVSAGNGFEADCHSKGTLVAGEFQELVWLLRPEDPTSNQVEIWYEGAAQLELLLKPPDSAALQPPVGPNQWKVITRTSDNKVIGWITHEHVAGSGAGSNVIRINLGCTAGEDGSQPKAVGPGNQQQGNQQQGMPPLPSLAAPVPSGAWTLRLRNPPGKPTANFHAWIERDDMRRRRRRRGQQSRFREEDADAMSTVADLGTGGLVICVGAHNTASSEMCRYSACGPTRDGRPKPDLTAPAEETASGGGVLCASARRGRPARMGGTSAAAPHVAGLVALIMQITDGARLTADAILRRLTAGAVAARGKARPPVRELHPNTHQEVDAHRNGRRQADHFPTVIGAGKVNVPESTR